MDELKITVSDRLAIRQVIEQQLQAFQRDDAEAAFTFASPGIQEYFQNPENFIAMVQSSYMPVYRPRSVMFEDVMTVEGNPAQKVILLEASGQIVVAVYLMQQQPDSSWRINGCLLMPLNQEAA